jgi:hypothetical protein
MAKQGKKRGKALSKSQMKRTKGGTGTLGAADGSVVPSDSTTDLRKSGGGTTTSGKEFLTFTFGTVSTTK